MASRRLPKKTNWQTTGRGSAFKVSEKGALFLEFQSWRVLALRPTPARAWEKRASDPRWMGRRDIDLDVASLAREVRLEDGSREVPPRSFADSLNNQPFFRRRRTSFRLFLEHVPPPVENVLVMGWAGETWPLLRLLVASDAAVELALSGDANLVAALGSAHRLLATPPRDTLRFARTWLRRPRRELAGRLGLPPTTSSVKILRKLKPEDVQLPVLHQLRSSLHHEPCRKVLCHAPVLTNALVMLVQPDLLPHLSPSMIKELQLTTHANSRWGLDRLARDAVGLQRHLHPGQSLVFSSLEDLRSRHDELVAERRKQRKLSNIAFPPPPLHRSGDEHMWMEPLSSSWALHREGCEMKHCLGALDSHHDLAVQGRFYAWSINRAGERLTLAIARDGATWELYDLRGPANADPSAGAVRFAATVVERANAGTGGVLSLVEPLPPNSTGIPW